MNIPKSPSSFKKSEFQQSFGSSTIANGIINTGLTEKGGTYFTQILQNNEPITVKLSENELDSLYTNWVLPMMLDILPDLTEAFLSDNEKSKNINNKMAAIKNHFEELIALLDLIERNPRASYEMKQKRDTSRKIVRSIFESQSESEDISYALTEALCSRNGHYLLAFLAKNDFLPQGYLDTDRRYFHLALTLKEHSLEELVDYNKKEYISRDILSLFLSSEEILAKYRSSKNTKYLRAISCMDLIGLYLNKSISFSEISDSRISQNNFYNLILNHDISTADLMLLAKDSDFEKLFPSSDKLLELYNKFALGGKTMLELVSLGKVSHEAIPSLYEKEHALQNAIIVPKAFDEKYLTTAEDFRQLFSIDFMLRLENNGNFTPELVNFYKSTIVPSCEDEKEEFYSKRRESLKELELTNDNIPTLLSLAEKGILSIDDISALDIKESDLSLDGLSCEKLCILYSAGKIDEINLLDKDLSPTELITCWKKDLLAENTLDVFLNPVDFENAYFQGHLECKDMLHLFNAGKIKLENLDCLEQSELQETILQMNVLSNDEKNNAHIEDRFISPEKIAELFSNKKVDYDTFRKLYDDGKISEEFYNQAVEEYDIESEMKKIRKLLYIENTATLEGPTFLSSPLPLPGPLLSKRKVSIDPELRSEFLKTLGYENPLLITTGALKGYMFIPIPSLKTVVLEKLYNANSRAGALTPALNNATFVLPFIKALELAQSSNKTDLRSEDNVYLVNHTKGWANNLLKKIREVNPNFEYKRYKEDYSDLIELISENYTENRGE